MVTGNVTGVGSGWTGLANDSGGTDYSAISYKVAGASESTTQTPTIANSSIGMVVWEVSGQNASPFILATMATPGSATGQSSPSAPGMANILALAYITTDGSTSATIGSALNMTQDQLVNTGDQHLVAGHSTGAKPIAQLFATFSVASTARTGLVLITT